MRRVEHFSNSHIETIKNNFPNIIINDDWLSEKWSDEFINQAKEIEYRAFNKDNFAKYIAKNINKYKKSEEYVHLSELIRRNKVQTVRSVGSGFSFKEILLSKTFPNTQFFLDDISPGVKLVKNYIKEERLNNIKIGYSDKNNYDKCDLTLCIAVIYCIDDLDSFVKYLRDITKENGYIYILHSAYLNFFTKFKILFKPLKRSNTKKTGYRMDLGYLLKIFSDIAPPEKISYYEIRPPRFFSMIFHKLLKLNVFRPIFASQISLTFKLK